MSPRSNLPGSERPSHRSRTCRATKTDSHKMWDMVERLRLSGLVVKRDVIGGRKYVYLNRQLPIYPALLRLFSH